MRRHFFSVADPDPIPHGSASELKAVPGSASKSKGGSESGSKYMSCRGATWSHGGLWKYKMRLKMEPWKVCIQVVADSHNIDEEQDPEPDPHHSEK